VKAKEMQMPYKNPEARRAYDREYKRNLRADLRSRQPMKPKARVYICFRNPHLRLPGGVQFRDGLYVTSDPKAQDVIEQGPDFGRNILRLAVVE
jgi:hypothetical protein